MKRTTTGADLSERLRTARIAAGLTQQQLADACGVSMQAVSAWERGRSQSLTAAHLFGLADTLRIDARYLATGESTVARPGQQRHRQLIADLDALPPRKAALVRQLVRELKD